jgi:hypothetical protein
VAEPVYLTAEQVRIARLERELDAVEQASQRMTDALERLSTVVREFVDERSARDA